MPQIATRATSVASLALIIPDRSPARAFHEAEADAEARGEPFDEPYPGANNNNGVGNDNNGANNKNGVDNKNGTAGE